METTTALFETYIKDWKTEVSWSEREIEKISKLLLEISKLNGGHINNDIDLDPIIRDQYILKTIDDGINKVMHDYTGKLKKEDQPGYYWKETDDLNPTFDFNRSVMYVEKVDLNAASVEDLISIPLINQALAEKLVQFREENGLFTEIDELLKIDGFDEKMIKPLGYALEINATKKEEEGLPLSAVIFLDEPNFRNYLSIFKKGESYLFDIGEPKPLSESLAKETIKELEKVVRYLRKNPYSKHGKYHRVRASRIKEDYDNHQFVNNLEANAAGEYKGASVLDDTQYLYFLLRVIKAAQKRIRIIMFFMAYKEEGRYPTQKIMDAILEAKERGVDVKVILDKDAEGDVYGSRIINNDAYKKFTEAGIQVLFDFEEKVTHSKIVLVDDDHTIIGSHNWTAGSFYAYDDKSMYVESADFTSMVSDYFDSLWQMYGGK